MTLFLNPRATPAQRLGAIASVVLALTGHAALAATPDADGSALLNNPAGRRRWPAPASTFQTPRATFIRPSSRPGKT